MDEREVEPFEDTVRRSLKSLDEVSVSSLASVRAARAGSPLLRLSGAFLASALVVIVALVAGDRLAVWRSEHAAGTPPTATVPAPLSRIAPDARYGLLVRQSGKTSSVSLVDELGHELIPSIDNVVLAKTSPNGRYIALWLSSGGGFELRMLDGVTKTVGQPLFTTTERFARQSLALIWASDSSAVLVATTADPVVNSSGVIRANLRAIGLTGDVRLVTTYPTFALAPLAWDRSKGSIVARAVPQQGGSQQVLVRMSEDGGSRVETTIADDPVIANDAGTYIASWVSCVAQPPCRRFAIHDAATYAVVGQVDLPDLLGGSGMTSVQFRPRSSDVLVNFSRTLTSSEGQFALVLYPDAARGKPHDLGTYSVKSQSQPDPKAQAAVPTPNAVIRADGSAAFFTHSTTIGTTNADQEGWLVELTDGSGAGVKTSQPIASVLLDANLVLDATTPSTPGPASCVSGETPVLDITLPPPPGYTPGSGAATPEAAFARARPDATTYVVSHPFGTSATAPVWITTGGETFVAQILGASGGNNWFAYPARFVGCGQLVDGDAIARVRSSQAGVGFAQFPSAPGSSTCTAGGGGPAPGLAVSGTCRSDVVRSGSEYDVTFTFTWQGSDFHLAGEPDSGTLSHSWVFHVDGAGAVTLRSQSGNFPPQYAK